jgi:hypothetical protein
MNITDLLQNALKDKEVPPIDEEYNLFADGKYKNKPYHRLKCSYRLLQEVDKIRLQSNVIDLDAKDLIARRHGWGRYEENDDIRYGKGYIGESLSEMEVLEMILKKVSDVPKDYNIDHLDPGEAERLVLDFLYSSRAS